MFSSPVFRLQPKYKQQSAMLSRLCDAHLSDMEYGKEERRKKKTKQYFHLTSPAELPQ